MEALRKILKRKGNKITIDVPEDFKAENIEGLILSIDNNDISSEETDWREFSISNFSKLYGEDEPDYSTVMVKEPNKKYNK